MRRVFGMRVTMFRQVFRDSTLGSSRRGSQRRITTGRVVTGRVARTGVTASASIPGTTISTATTDGPQASQMLATHSLTERQVHKLSFHERRMQNSDRRVQQSGLEQYCLPGPGPHIGGLGPPAWGHKTLDANVSTEKRVRLRGLAT